MPVNLNAVLLPELPPELANAQRGLFYADALFETLRAFDGRLPWLERHLERLFAGLQALGYERPVHWNAAFFHREIQRVAPPNARIRLTVWRAPGGLYAPEDPTPQFLITAQALEHDHFQWPDMGLSVGICETVRLPVDAFSGFKTLNAARYVAAAREARTRGWDDGLLLNSREDVAEATSSNVFWWEDDRLYTPPLSAGCVAGVMRHFLLRQFSVQEVPLRPERLASAKEIFLTNAIRGIVPVRIFAGRHLDAKRTKDLFLGLSDKII